ncbi:beta-ketoacyl-ACP synthase III [candidate division WOR-3 bacterium]|uniref:Beta-ketoacyl-[acyl-carrier-protein] synthase III n=1 Tax=candidate division WOR-3 bacterium TaxID=2052148 RepID=A0A9D5QD19_UNCW3|nr:beta-ketoacyl-ACP synthase III [candidate division WOR-3 bacterium]MBD3364586.1 beta-ketoacyl-ACP synthase III [candidate division WOR-3 bacterium]
MKFFRRFKILGTGSFLPEKVLTNHDLEKMVDTSDEWIKTRTGIEKRHIAANNEATSDMIFAAAKDALKNAGLAASALGAIIVGTVTPDTMFPSTGCWVQRKLDIPGIPAFDVSAACSGFLYGMEIATSMLPSIDKPILVAGADALSKITNWQDRGTCVLMGDGAGVVIIAPTTEDRGYLSSLLGADGALGELLIQHAGGSRMPASHETVDKNLHTIDMKGNEIFKHAVRTMGDAAVEAIAKSGVPPDDIDMFVPHQANHRIIEATCRRAKVPLSKTHITISWHGNMSAGTIPIAFHDAVSKGIIKRDDKVLFAAFGGGFTWGASVLVF